MSALKRLLADRCEMKATRVAEPPCRSGTGGAMLRHILDTPAACVVKESNPQPVVRVENRSLLTQACPQASRQRPDSEGDLVDTRPSAHHHTVLTARLLCWSWFARSCCFRNSP
jgi:hypothetical protein